MPCHVLGSVMTATELLSLPIPLPIKPGDCEMGPYGKRQIITSTQSITETKYFVIHFLCWDETHGFVHLSEQYCTTELHPQSEHIQ